MFKFIKHKCHRPMDTLGDKEVRGVLENIYDYVIKEEAHTLELKHITYSDKDKDKNLFRGTFGRIEGVLEVFDKIKLFINLAVQKGQEKQNENK